MAKRLMEEARNVFRAHHYSYRTEVTYLKWIKRFIKYQDNRPPRELGPAEIQAFLTDLATRGKDRLTILPESLIPHLEQQLDVVRGLLARDRERGREGVSMPDAIGRKYVNAGLSWRWQYIFPSRKYAFIRSNMGRRRHHSHPSGQCLTQLQAPAMQQHGRACFEV